eukprot:m.34726 g.34726  ORF g.34726 m.34726 type:complete len:63 (-) comp9800_c1_seq1:324-512(-)
MHEVWKQVIAVRCVFVALANALMNMNHRFFVHALFIIHHHESCVQPMPVCTSQHALCSPRNG